MKRDNEDWAFSNAKNGPAKTQNLFTGLNNKPRSTANGREEADPACADRREDYSLKLKR